MLGDTTRSEKTLSWGVRSWCGDVTNEGGFPHLKALPGGIRRFLHLILPSLAFLTSS